jgi:hypothetical protein
MQTTMGTMAKAMVAVNDYSAGGGGRPQVAIWIFGSDAKSIALLPCLLKRISRCRVTLKTLFFANVSPCWS